jgi:hypothetical protein
MSHHMSIYQFAPSQNNWKNIKGAEELGSRSTIVSFNPKTFIVLLYTKNKEEYKMGESSYLFM